MPRPIVPEEMQGYVTEWRMSPGLECDGFIFMTGFTGAQPDGSLSDDPETQIRDAFEKVGTVLAAAGLHFGALVEMTTYHVGLKDHLDVFQKVRDSYVQHPFPAWTAIEVAGFVQEGAIVEIRAIARRPD